MKPNNKHSVLKHYLIILVIIILAEVFIFNWRFFDGLDYKSTNLTNFVCGSGVKYTDTNEIYVSSTGDKWIEFNDINTKIDNVYINIADKRNYDKNQNVFGTSRDWQRLAVTLSVTDEANAQYMSMPERFLAEGVERTKYIKLHTAGESGKLKIQFNDSNNQTLKLKSVTINKQVPFKINILRMFLLFAVTAVVFALRYNSPIYEIKRRFGSKKQLALTVFVVMVNIALTAIVCFSNPKFMEPNLEHHKQYAHLADAFLNGHVYLDYAEPPQALTDMENPYDKNERDNVMAANNTSYKWDHAYYNGKYYVYFGALPVLVYYLPFKAITGYNFSTYAGVFINLAVYIIFIYLLLNTIVKKWFKNTPFVSFILMAQVLTFSSGIIFAMRKPDLYAMPITMGLTLTVMGLYFWISSQLTASKSGECARLLAGSLCMALVAGCRPQLLLGSFLAIPLFWNRVFKKRDLLSKTSLPQTLCFILPYVFIAVAVMWYNHVRFGSVFDFGANYNLTTNDMTRRGINLGRLPLGLFCYFLQLPVTYAKFPFITGCNLSNSYMGTTICEMMLGGIFAVKPVLWLIALIKYVKQELKNKSLFAFVICSALFSVIIAAADTQMAGILYRYYMDYTLFMLIAAAFIAFALAEKHKDKKFLAILTAMCLLCLLYDAVTVFVHGDYSIEYSNPNFYYSIESALAFYL